MGAPRGHDLVGLSEVIDVPAGDTVDVPVYVTITDAKRLEPTTLDLVATSETDGTKSATSTAVVSPQR